MARYLWIGFFACELWFLTVLAAESPTGMRVSDDFESVDIWLRAPSFDAFVMGQPQVLLPLAILLRERVRGWESGSLEWFSTSLYLLGVCWFWQRQGGRVPLAQSYLVLRMLAFVSVWTVGTADWFVRLAAVYWLGVVLVMGLRLVGITTRGRQGLQGGRASLP